MRKVKILLRRCNIFMKMDIKLRIGYIKAFTYTGVARLYILFVPFNKLKNKMGRLKSESAEEVDIETIKKAKNVTSLVTTISKYTPWESKCLVQALTAQKLLKEQGISTTLYLGVKKDKNNSMLAHAWLRCGTYYVTGGWNKDGYAVVAKFAN